MFRFTIRDVIWLTVVVALAVGWWIDRLAHVSRNSALERANAELSVEVRQQAERPKKHGGC